MMSISSASSNAQQHLPHMNFRKFIEALKADADLVEIDEEVDPHLEVGAIIRKVCEETQPAPLFNKLKGQDENGLWRILGAPNSWRADPTQKWGRLARHIGLKPSASIQEICDKLEAAKAATPIQPLVVETGSCKEFILTPDNFDLTTLPCPQLHRSDGGKYVQTYGMHVIQSPDGKWTNWSIARSMVVDKNHIVSLIALPQHLAQIHELWKKEGRDMPWALVLGAPPAAIMAASMPLPDGVSEAEYVGALAGSPVHLTKCETNDLYVPANSEIVFEGSISITETALEGPYGEMHGYVYPADKLLAPVHTIDLITHRKDAILPVCNAGRYPDETQIMVGPLCAVEISALLKAHQMPVKRVFTPVESQTTWSVIQVDTEKLAAMKTTRDEFCRKIGDIVFGNKAGLFIHRLLLVGEDIDIYNFKDVLWAFCTRCRPGTDEYHFESHPGFLLIPFMYHGNGPKFTGGNVVSDCLMPVEYATGKQDWDAADFKGSFPPEVQKKVFQRWSALGYSK